MLHQKVRAERLRFGITSQQYIDILSATGTEKQSVIFSNIMKIPTARRENSVIRLLRDHSKAGHVERLSFLKEIHANGRHDSPVLLERKSSRNLLTDFLVHGPTSVRYMRYFLANDATAGKNFINFTGGIEDQNLEDFKQSSVVTQRYLSEPKTGCSYFPWDVVTNVFDYIFDDINIRPVSKGLLKFFDERNCVKRLDSLQCILDYAMMAKTASSIKYIRCYKKTQKLNPKEFLDSYKFVKTQEFNQDEDVVVCSKSRTTRCNAITLTGAKCKMFCRGGKCHHHSSKLVLTPARF